MIDDPDRCYAALQARDPRYDGWFIVAVSTTGIYCRPSCPARTPRRDRVRFFSTSAAAQGEGFRACKRCRPDTSPGSPEWDQRADLVGRAMRLIADGVVDRDGVEGLARRLGYTPRHLHRQLRAEVGAGPLSLARAQRAQTARTLIESTAMPFTEVAYASGFRSLRRFNDTVREVFDLTPTELRRRARSGASIGSSTLRLRLPLRRPIASWLITDHLAVRAIDGVEQVCAQGFYRRSLALPRGEGVVEFAMRSDHVQAHLHLTDLRDLTAAVDRSRRMLDLDADPEAVDAHLAADPVLAPLVAAAPGIRVPSYPDPFEAAVRTLLGQQVSLAGARRFWTRLVARTGGVLDHPIEEVTRRFPSAEELAEADLAGLGLTTRRERALRHLAIEVAAGDIDLRIGADRDVVRASLAAVPGIGPWTVEEVALRGLADPDAFPETDLVLRQVAARLGLGDDAAQLRARAERWRPWRAYAAQHLWTNAVAERRAA